MNSPLKTPTFHPATYGGPHPLTTKPDIAQLLRTIREPMAAVESDLRASMRSRDPFADALIGYGWSLGGKRLRPALVLLTAQALGSITEETRRLAVVVELVHTATLVHDDVLDGASYRRHVPTVHTQWDTHCSILLGDFLFTEAYYQASLCDSPLPSRLVGQAAKQLCEGEIRQRGTIDNWNLPVDQYLDILRGKTAELCAVSTCLGAWSVKASPEAIQAAERYGRNLGLAFQIFDDWLDLWGDDTTVGKSLGTDLVTGKPTLPILRLLETLEKDDRAEVMRILHGDAQHRLELLRPWLEKSDASQYTLEFAERFVSAAISDLDCFPDSPEKIALELLARFSVSRQK
jgi:octaprenyl-diphosphate synthase